MKTFYITVDAGYMFDFLSIYDVKLLKIGSGENNQNLKNFNNTESDIVIQIGEDLYSKIIKSQEYQNLYYINRKLFDLVDLAKDDKVKASEVDAYVYKRFLAKKALRLKFFPESEEVEQKSGYEKKV